MKYRLMTYGVVAEVAIGTFSLIVLRAEHDALTTPVDSPATSKTLDECPNLSGFWFQDLVYDPIGTYHEAPDGKGGIYDLPDTSGYGATSAPGLYVEVNLIPP